MEVLKIATAGSVDDGKSTLIGRLLNDTKSLTTDKLIAIERKSKQKGYDYIDFSLITDGLIAEREQGITIDVAHIYFSTNTKSYIIADTPGHLEYTRNMVTGASTSQASIILIDARKGVTEQTKRHFFINDLLRMEHVIVAINKMDLVEYDENVFLNVMSDFKSLIDRRVYKSQKITFIPVCALHGDNIVNGSKVMNWYNGLTLITYLELLEMEDNNQNERIRFPVQYIIRPKTEKYHDFRGYAGKVYGGQLNVGDPVVVLPSFKKSKIKDIYFYNEKYESASKDSSVNITLEDEININRGDMIVKEQNLPFVSKNLTAIITWMDRDKLIEGKKYIVQHGVNKVISLVEKIHHKVCTNYKGIEGGTEELEMNDIGKVTFKLNKPIFYDTFENHKSNGVFILIDRQTNNTVGVGFIE